MKRNDHDAPDQGRVELAGRLWELDGGHENGGLFPDAFVRAFTDFESWDEFKVRLAATPRTERDRFMATTTRFASYEEMERTALARLAGRHAAGGRAPAVDAGRVRDTGLPRAADDDAAPVDVEADQGS